MLLSKIIQLTTDIKSHKSSLNQAANQKGKNSKEVLRIKKKSRQGNYRIKAIFTSKISRTVCFC